MSNAHHLVVNQVGTVEDDTLLSRWLGEILGWLCVPSAGRTSGICSKVEL